MIELQ